MDNNRLYPEICGDLILSCHTAAEKILSQEDYMRWRQVHSEIVDTTLPHYPFSRPKDYKYKPIWVDAIWCAYVKKVVEAWLEFE
jgi:hypothetical protein